MPDAEDGAQRDGQLALDIGLREGRGFDDFVSGRNEAVVAALRDLSLPDGEGRIFIAGERSSGKTHLLQATCEAAHARGRPVRYLPMSELAALAPAAVDSLGAEALVCIDDVDAVAGCRAWEIALLSLFEENAASRASLVAAASDTPSRVPFALADLGSRLSTAAFYRITPLDDRERADLLRLKASARGFDLSDDVVGFILSRSRRDVASLLRVLDRLDERSLVEKRRPTLHLVRSLFH